MKRMSAPRAFAAPCLHRDLIHPGERICAAVSGGADSVALLLLLHEANALARNALGIGLSAVHVHHGLRGAEAEDDLAFVEDLCRHLGVPLHVRRTSVPDRLAQARAEGRPETMEEAARNARYAAFAEILRAAAVDAIVTAHTLDDQAETVLHRLLRGAWTEGLVGIHPIVQPPPGASPGTPGRIVRPVLHLRRAELREYLELRRQPWREDATNADPAHTRNRLRHTVLPMLREENPAIDTTLAHLATLAREEEARWSAELARVLPQILLPGVPVRGGGRASRAYTGESATVALELERLRSMDPALRRRVVRAAARTLGVRLSFDETAALLDLAGLAPAAERGPHLSRSRRLTLANGLLAERSPRELRLHRIAPSFARGAASDGG